MQKKPAIVLSNVTKKYRVLHEKPTLVEQIFKRQETRIFTALDKVELKLPKGSKVGIIGHNGAGKTTLLKILAGITTPTSGEVVTNGKVLSLINIAAGFQTDLSGFDNIYLQGMLLGMNRKVLDGKIADIISFADIGDFISSPMYTYSDGMKLRVAFSVAIHSDPDILLLDEAVLAGDTDFQLKIQSWLRKIRKSDVTVLVVSHWLEFLQKSADHFIWMEQGKIIAQGGSELIERYEQSYTQ